MGCYHCARDRLISSCAGGTPISPNGVLRYLDSPSKKGLCGQLQPSSKCALLSALLSLLHYFIGRTMESSLFDKNPSLQQIAATHECCRKDNWYCCTGNHYHSQLYPEFQTYFLQIVDDTGGSIVLK